VIDASKKLGEKLDEVEKALYQTQNRSPQDPLNYPIRLNDKLAALLGLAGYGQNRPTEQMVQAKAELTAAADAELRNLEKIWDEDVPAFNQLAREHEVPAVMVETAGDDEP
jgi:hypothetical protein